ncbi:hypothetical protein [Naasia lichenicola]|nr:hypothetical protein [Naasia lichenicola]
MGGLEADVADDHGCENRHHQIMADANDEAADRSVRHLVLSLRAGALSLG